MKTLILTLAALIATLPFSSFAIEITLPPIVKDAITDAKNSGNGFVVDAVVAHSKTRYPAYAKMIDEFAATTPLHVTVNSDTALQKPSQKKPVSPSPKAQKPVKTVSNIASHKLSGSIDTSAVVSTGNTDKQNLSANSKLNYAFGEFINTLELTARYSEDENIRTNEEYFIDNQTKYTITPDLYSYLELEYVNDRFSGFQYRTSELLGMGYKFINLDDFTLTGEAGAGARQSKTTDNIATSSALGKVGINTLWKVTDTITFENKTNSAYASDALITISDTSLKTTIIESLYLKLGYNLQHVDDVPADTKHIDTLTTIGIGYEF